MAIGDDAADRFEFLGGDREGQSGKTLEERREGDRRLRAGEGCAETEVRAVAE